MPAIGNPHRGQLASPCSIARLAASRRSVLTRSPPASESTTAPPQCIRVRAPTTGVGCHNPNGPASYQNRSAAPSWPSSAASAATPPACSRSDHPPAPRRAGRLPRPPRRSRPCEHKPDIRIRSPKTRLLCIRLGTGQSGATLATCIMCDGSPRPQADMCSRTYSPRDRCRRIASGNAATIYCSGSWRYGSAG